MKRYFEYIKDINELKKEYRRLIKENHPDNGGETKTVADINNEYEEVFNRLKEEHNAKAAADKTGKTKPMTETPEEFKNIIEKIINLSDITIEICGSWIWVSGNTFEHKDVFKACGFRWASAKKMWYWRNEVDATRSRGKSQTMEHIRNKYGSETIIAAENQQLMLAI